MNMFRDLAIVALMGLGAALMLSDPATWTWISVLGPDIASPIYQGLEFLYEIKIFSALVCYALALALFMTRIKF